MKRLPELGSDAVVRISRQGGFAAIAALSHPREIDFAQCDPNQRGQVCSVLQTCLPMASQEAGKGDQRFYRIELRIARQDAPGELVLQIPEERAPSDLVKLWEKGA
ncbi:hypothetical protein SAMN05216588_11832 [Pseudomonas flavescens]|uniref:Uncharacterized protein n=1 Tax=Phytopseudomonas flavescens TaxID=29435 RepID=A0A1G8L415_9GAMM|nr:protealysin inhibitor emfourin [Pseudomonas flavescens]SDI50453.1 hypothetical protein SAMN05216588_11832 [Pseudomonas flavescens]